MNRILLVVLIFASCVLMPSTIAAHDGDHPPDMRVWKDADGLFEIEASFVVAKDGSVQLLKHDGTLVWVPMEKLSKQDQTWIQRRLDAIRRINGQSPMKSPTYSQEDPDDTNSDRADPIFLITGLVIVVCGCLVIRLLARTKNTRMASVIVVISIAGLIAIAKEEKPAPNIQKHFEPFKDKIKYRFDDNYFYIESNGMPDHPMMIGITAWQQQVPIPQPYTGRNAWQIPLHPKMADKPVSAKEQLFRGAIAVAVNGVPIFNPIKNDGRTDTYLAGELDEYGGHCGRADDYHYHIGPVHLEKIVGKGNPIGYALDGYPLYGYYDADGKMPKDLDAYNGRMEKDGYRYYSTKKYPYINGGMRGVVTVRDDQIDPQPRATSPRAAMPPLRGAKITDFIRDDNKKSVTVKYDLKGKTHSVKYTANMDGSYTFIFTDGTGKETTETYRVRPDGKRPPPRKDDRPKKGGPKDGRPKKDGPPPKKEELPGVKAAGAFKLSSSAFEPGGKYPVEYTGDGAGVSPPLQWTGAPTGTKYYALQLWHKPKADGDEIKSYWVITNIPANVTSLEKNTRGVGKDGYNDKKRTGYDPMNSKGPGVKLYHITMYALSEEPKFSSDRVTRADLLKAIKDITLAETTLSYTYERKSN